MGFLRELNMAKTYVLVVSFCFLCYLHVYQPLLSILNHGDNTPDSVVNAIDCRAATLPSMNSTLNCPIIFRENREMSKVCSKGLKKCFHRQMEVQQFQVKRG